MTTHYTIDPVLPRILQFLIFVNFELEMSGLSRAGFGFPHSLPINTVLYSGPQFCFVSFKPNFRILVSFEMYVVILSQIHNYRIHTVMFRVSLSG